eukprot:TRINITY_DN1568_c0_g1_i2.p1 TRINITY_DN1568_c0_g1~~TRINITY_DN1568_c0_g1_i2.p1  ORF type:complete len:236 (-),score=38.38 TRINITY_DN1568_c0_g1_i2:176-883(-)
MSSNNHSVWNQFFYSFYLWICSLFGFWVSGGDVCNCSTELQISDFQSNFIRSSKLTTHNLLSMSKKILVLDLDETLVHSTTKRTIKFDYQVEVVIDSVLCKFYVSKRPFVEFFLKTISEWFEVVIFTASLKPYANAVIDQLDPHGFITKRLYRESCVNKGNGYVKDLSKVHEDLSQVMILDNSPVAYALHRENAIPISDWLANNSEDEELLDLLPFLNGIRPTKDVRSILMLKDL